MKTSFEPLFMKMFYASPLPMTIASKTDGCWVEVNDALCQMIEYTRDEVIGRTSLEMNLINPQARAAILRELQEKKVLNNFEIETKTKSGRKLYLVASHFEIEMDGEKFLIAMMQDTTERKLTEQALRESENKFSVLFNKSPIAAAITAIPQGRFIEVNAEFERFFGFSRLEVIGKTSGELELYPDSETQQQSIAQFQKNSFIRNLEAPIKTKNNNVRHVLINSDVVEINQQKFVLTTAGDITERKQYEEALAAEKERLAVTLRSIGDGVITTDMKARISIMNPVAESLTGWAQSDALGRPIGEVFKIVHEHTRLPCENPVEKVLSLDNAVDLANHTVLISRDGTERIIADSGAPIKDRSGKTLGVVLVFHDTTEKEKLTEVTYKVQKLESLGVLAGGIAHDFNNLLGGIFGYLDLARSETDFHTASQHLDKALTTMDRARALTMQLLTFSKGGTPVRKTGRLFPFLRETVQFALSGSNVSCKFDTPDNLWSCSFDQNQISQVFDNLVINAQQAMPLGGVIEVAAKNESLDVHRYPSLPPGKYIRVSVSDHGVGIPRNLINKIFDPFFTTRTKGHGLGLATCFSIIRKHDGYIDVETEIEKGSTFHVLLPATEELAHTEKEKRGKQHSGSGYVIVLDDEDSVREIIVKMLQSFGYQTVATRTAQEAVDAYHVLNQAENRIAAMFFDLTIAGGAGGLDAAKEVRKTDSNTPLFVVSGYSNDPVMKNPSAFGFTDSLRKPFRVAELAEMLNISLKS